ncbi:dihydrofolate reductase [Roseateles sp. BYS87W]|uniref:Dihydrofolate reductase n=1 Tax=Pelomonas baiyunensis TaxID=3299026 RepID=A0ABW7GY64_9BURK
MTRVVLVAAVAQDGAIGRDNALLWHLPEDLARFKAITLGKPVIMGRKTWDSLPPRFRPLPGRRNLVVSRSTPALGGAEVFASFDAALAACQGVPEVCVIGGSEIYALAMPHAHQLALTEVDARFPDADRHFPPWPRERFTVAAREAHTSASGLHYEFIDYVCKD